MKTIVLWFLALGALLFAFDASATQLSIDQETQRTIVQFVRQIWSIVAYVMMIGGCIVAIVAPILGFGFRPSLIAGFVALVGAAGEKFVNWAAKVGNIDVQTSALTSSLPWIG